MGRASVLGLGIAAIVTGACGGGAAQAPAPSAPEPAAAAPAAASAAASAPASAAAPESPSGSASAVASEAYSDPTEKPDGEMLAPLFTKTKKPAFPKKTTNDRECWATLAVSGKHDKDYDTITGACGAPTGLVEYAKPVQGKLHNKHDPRDVFKLPLLGGYCYRYFAVADEGISDLDLLIQKPGGALVGDDQTTSPVAIIESDKPWCLDEDQTLEFHVKVDGTGTGGYTFGVWARPKGK